MFIQIQKIKLSSCIILLTVPQRLCYEPIYKASNTFFTIHTWHTGAQYWGTRYHPHRSYRCRSATSPTRTAARSRTAWRGRGTMTSAGRSRCPGCPSRCPDLIQKHYLKPRKVEQLLKRSLYDVNRAVTFPQLIISDSISFLNVFVDQWVSPLLRHWARIHTNYRF